MSTTRPSTHDAGPVSDREPLGHGADRASGAGGFVRPDRAFLAPASAVCVVAAYCGLRQDSDGAAGTLAGERPDATAERLD